jgi:DNA (cytosine-5)-methyltransferase 1
MSTQQPSEHTTLNKSMCLQQDSRAQPTSQIGKRLAQDDERWIWPQIARLVRELRPRFVLLENTPGLLNATTDQLLETFSGTWPGGVRCGMASVIVSGVWGTSYSGVGSGLWPTPMASDMKRLRFSIQSCLAHVESQAKQGRKATLSYRRGNGDTLWPTPNDRVCGVVDEISERLDGYHALGNAVDPVITEWIGRQLIAALKGE